MLADKAKQEGTMTGLLSKKSSDANRWQVRYFRLYQNVMFYYENDASLKPLGLIFLEGSYIHRLITTSRPNSSTQVINN